MINVDTYEQSLAGHTALVDAIVDALKTDGNATVVSDQHVCKVKAMEFKFGKIGILTHYITSALGKPIVRHKIGKGLEIVVAAKKPEPLVLARWELQKTVHIIAAAEILMTGGGDLTNPATKPKIRCKLLLRDQQGRRLRITTDWEDGKFVHHGDPLDALNAEEVAQEVRKSCMVG